MSKRIRFSTATGMSRRSFLRLSSVSSLALSPRGLSSPQENRFLFGGIENPSCSAQKRTTSIREYLYNVTWKRKEVDTFLDPKAPNAARFDPELGYTYRDEVVKDGMDGCRTVRSFEKTGERTMINYAHKPCRINAYGDSFTFCEQTSDGETWEEHLAAHIGEPIRNFGVGGYGTYQAYLWMRRQEATPSGVEYLIFNCSLEDHLRSIDESRWIRYQPMWRIHPPPGHLYMFQGNPWAHIRLNLESGELVEIKNVFPTPQSMYKLCDPDFVYEHFKNDLVVKLVVAANCGTDVDQDELGSLARALNVNADFSSPEATAKTAVALHAEYALRAGMRLIEKVQAYASAQKKKLMVLLTPDPPEIVAVCEGRPRSDQSFVDFVKAKNIFFVDGVEKYVEYYKNFKISPGDYLKRYYTGHPNPIGNQFFAFAIKDAIVNWLDPKPPAYREGSETIPAVI